MSVSFTKNISSRSKAIGAVAGLAFAGLALTPAASYANCIPSKPWGWVIPVTVTTQNAGAVATYFTGSLYSRTTKGEWSGAGEQLFSNRTGCLAGSGCTVQPFAANSPDLMSITVNTARYTVITLPSQGNNEVTFTGRCDVLTNMFYGSASWPGQNATMMLFTFGTPYQIPR